MTGRSAAAAGCYELLRLRPGVYHAVDRGGVVYLLHRSSSQRLGRLDEAQRGILRRLADAADSAEPLRVPCGLGCGLDEADWLMRSLRAGGWLRITVVHDGRRAYTIEPYRHPASPGDDDAGSGFPVLSRFAVLRRDGADLVVESPLSWCAIRVHDPGVAAAVAASTGSGVPAARDPLPAALARRLRSDLTWAAMLVAASGAEDSAFELRQWGPHELWFHMRSRGEGVPEGHFGATMWAAGLFEPLPARRASFTGERVELTRPDLGVLQRDDATLTDVLERRRSVRRHDDEHPIALEQVGEFLYRAAGVRSVVSCGGVECVTGPNPSGGALDELEFYLAVRLARGLAPGLYRYDRFGHWLERICGPTGPVRRLIGTAQNATSRSGTPDETWPPQVVILLAARFGRIGWRYETMAYAAVLKHVGVVYQTMYCVATAMGLAPCALGAGNTAVFAEATGLDPLIEATVGEFALGSLPAAATQAERV